MNGRRLRGLVAAAIAIANAAPAVAAEHESEPALIAIVAEQGSPFGRRLAAELEAVGFRAATVEATAASPSPDSLEAAARDVGAIAAIRAVPAKHGVEMWLIDRVTGKTLRRELADAGADDAALALRSVELIRASLVEVTLQQPTRDEVPAPKQLAERRQLPAPEQPGQPEPTATNAPVFHVGVSPGAALDPGGFGPAATLGVGLAWMPSPRLGVVALGVFPVTRARASAPEGVADLSALIAGTGLRVAPLSPASRWAPAVDAGFAVAWVSTSATASAGFSGTEASSSTGAMFVRAGLGVALGSRLRLRADVLTLLTAGVTLRFAGREVATWGQPLFVPSLGAELGLF